jgi:hypothetical protein
MKATKAVVAQRIESVLRIRLDGAQLHDIRDYANAPEQGWNVSDSQLRRYIAASDKLLAERLERDRDKLFARHVAQRQTLFARAVNSADFRTALATAKDEAELEGLYPPKKIAPTDPTGDKEYGGGFTDDERRAILRAVVARLGLPDPLPDAGGALAADGSLLPGPAGPDAGCSASAGPLAGPGVDFGGPSDPDLVQPPERQEPDGRGVGAVDRDP